MKIVKFNDDLRLGDENSSFFLKYEKGIKYLVNEDLLKSIKNFYLSKIDEEEDYEIISTVPLKKTKKLLLYRSGGIGDLLFIIPYIPMIKEKYPEMLIDFCAFKANLSIIDFVGAWINKMIPDPLKFDDLLEYDKVIFFDKFIELNPKAEIINAFDIGKDFFDGIERGPLIQPKIWEKPTNVNKIRIMIQYSSSSLIRDINPLLWFEFILNLNKDLFEVIIIDSKNKTTEVEDLVQEIQKRTKISIKYFTSWEINETLNLMYHDQLKPHVFIGPDSGFTNIAGYLGIPTIGLYGPFPSKLRMQYYQRAIGIDTQTNCPYRKNEMGNCFQHGSGKCHLAKFKEERFSPCLELIDYTYLMSALTIMLQNEYNVNMHQFV